MLSAALAPSSGPADFPLPAGGRSKGSGAAPHMYGASTLGGADDECSRVSKYLPNRLVFLPHLSMVEPPLETPGPFSQLNILPTSTSFLLDPFRQAYLSQLSSRQTSSVV